VGLKLDHVLGVSEFHVNVHTFIASNLFQSASQTTNLTTKKKQELGEKKGRKVILLHKSTTRQ
jgi:hypothetical protein